MQHYTLSKVYSTISNKKRMSLHDAKDKTKNFPYKIYELNIKIKEKLRSDYAEQNSNYVLVGPKKYCLLEKYKEVASIFYNFSIRSSDIWLFGFPRSGTTLPQEIIWLIENNLNYEKAAETILDLRFPYLEQGSLWKIDNVKNVKCDEKINSVMKKTSVPTWKLLVDVKERRFIKSQLPVSLVNPDVLKNDCKVFYLFRNPKDVIVSNYFISLAFIPFGFKGSFEDFWNYFRNNLYLWTPYFEHIKEGWENRHNPNVLVLFYEEMVQDMRKSLVKIANFLKKPLNDEQLDKLENHLKIENFRKNKSVNNGHLRGAGLMKDEDDGFIRRGKINGWRDYFNEKLNAEADKWIEDNMKGCDLKFFE